VFVAPRVRRLAVGALLLSLGSLVGCSTQRWPSPMRPMSTPLPLGEGREVQPGLEEVEVIRHSDPVQLRRAGASAAFPMRFWSKKERARAGAWVLTDSGGRAELLWARDGTSVVLFDGGVAQLGERDRDEPAVRLRYLTRAKLQLGAGVVVEVEGGALLSADTDEFSGPYVLERLPIGDVLRLYNKGKHVLQVSYREATLDVAPGQAMDVPVLAAGSTPISVSSAGRTVSAGGLGLELEGPVEVVGGEPATLAAEGPSRVRALGVEVRLGSGDLARFTDLGRPADAPLAPSPSDSPALTGTASAPGPTDAPGESAGN
jgi:hypothetical protein